MSLTYTLMEAFSPEGKSKLKTAAKVGAGLAGALGAGAAAYQHIKSGEGLGGYFTRGVKTFTGNENLKDKLLNIGDKISGQGIGKAAGNTVNDASDVIKKGVAKTGEALEDGKKKVKNFFAPKYELPKNIDPKDTSVAPEKKPFVGF